MIGAIGIVVPTTAETHAGDADARVLAMRVPLSSVAPHAVHGRRPSVVETES
jgi:hypothetical protein